MIIGLYDSNGCSIMGFDCKVILFMSFEKIIFQSMKC